MHSHQSLCILFWSKNSLLLPFPLWIRCVFLDTFSILIPFAMGPIPGPFETSYPFLDAFQAVLSMKGQDPSAFSHITSSSGPRVSHKLTHSFPLHDARAILINTIIQGWHSDPGRIRERHTAQREEKKIARIDDSLRVSCQGLHGERVRVAIGNKEAEHPSSSLRRVAVV